MDQKSQLKIEFFQLGLLLNKSNLKMNQKTEISFFIQNEKGVPALYATTNGLYKIQLIKYRSNNRWATCNYTELTVLEEELVLFIKCIKIEEITSAELTRSIKLFIFQHIL
jgi:hypothetical protein